MRNDLALIGELGLGGEVRLVSNITARLKETAHLGFKELHSARAETQFRLGLFRLWFEANSLWESG